jgi:hypothetical protein
LFGNSRSTFASARQANADACAGVRRKSVDIAIGKNEIRGTQRERRCDPPTAAYNMRPQREAPP